MRLYLYMKYWLYALVILYVLWPFDFLPDIFVGVGWLDDLVILGILGWYHFVYRQRRRVDQDPHRAYRYTTGPNGEGHERPGEGFGRYGQAGEKPWQKDPYEVLGIERNASSDEIKKAYRLLVNQYHPDRVVHLGEEFRVLAEEKFKEIQQAYQEVLPNK